MPTFQFHQTTTATPEQFIAGLTDFGPGRAELFENSADGYLKVHDQGPNEADVTEGSAGVWERLRYDWSDPGRVVLTTTDSNAWANGASHTYILKSQPDGRTRHRLHRRPRGQEPQGTIPRPRPRDRRQGSAEGCVREGREGDRGPERRGESGGSLAST